MKKEKQSIYKKMFSGKGTPMLRNPEHKRKEIDSEADKIGGRVVQVYGKTMLNEYNDVLKSAWLNFAQQPMSRFIKRFNIIDEPFLRYFINYEGCPFELNFVENYNTPESARANSANVYFRFEDPNNALRSVYWPVEPHLNEGIMDIFVVIDIDPAKGKVLNFTMYEMLCQQKGQKHLVWALFSKGFIQEVVLS